jgi:hypothetical protein
MALGKTQDELLNHMSTDDFVEWAAYRRIKPFGYDVDNMRFGEICAMIINSAGKSYKQNVKWTDFFKPSYEMKEINEKKADPVSSLLAVFTAMEAQQKKNLEQEKILKEKEKEQFIKDTINKAKRRKRK